MMWEDFYDNYTEWSEATIRSRIYALEDMGSGDEVVDVALDLPTERLKAQLIRKAIRQGVRFTHDDFVYLDGELPDEVYRELAAHAGFDASNPDFDEDNLSWGDFYTEAYRWSEEDTLRRISKLREFGPSDEVCEAIGEMPNRKCADALWQRAVAAGGRFTIDELEEMGKVQVIYRIPDADDAQERACGEPERTGPAKQREKGLGFLGTLFFAMLGSWLGRGKKKHDAGRCDGDCAHCPPHYGYRYGRWYYGHGHQHGCQRGGNGGASGRTYRD